MPILELLTVWDIVWYGIRSGKQADMGTAKLYWNLFNSPCVFIDKSLGLIQLMIQVASEETELIQPHDSSGFPKE